MLLLRNAIGAVMHQRLVPVERKPVVHVPFYIFDCKQFDVRSVTVYLGSEWPRGVVEVKILPMETKQENERSKHGYQRRISSLLDSPSPNDEYNEPTHTSRGNERCDQPSG